MKRDFSYFDRNSVMYKNKKYNCSQEWTLLLKKKTKKIISHFVFFHKSLWKNMPICRIAATPLTSGFQKGWLLSLNIAKDGENMGIGMENSQRNGFFGTLLNMFKTWIKFLNLNLEPWAYGTKKSISSVNTILVMC